MASNTVEPTEIIYIECSILHPHGPHTWREGFLWHRKRSCTGFKKLNKSEWLRKNHKHNMVFDGKGSDVLFMHWICDVPGCLENYTRWRRDWNWETVGLPRVKERARTVIYKKQKI
ncbi:hypothetical protein SEA_MEDIUMFRY_70 [Arthrobacter phage MediumFry]|nr:hypothetical protein SEA_MEDIUMFRY_70 [Arthrobacter phage MediumFry]